MSVDMKLVPNPGDGIVAAIAQRTGRELGFTKNWFDTANVGITLVFGLVMGHPLCGIGLGTVLAMLGVGRVMALFNRLTNLLVKQDLYQKYLYGIVVSGYSGSDIVARQLLGAMCLNKTAILPPNFCLMQTAHDPGSVRTADGIDARITEFAARIAKIQTVQK